MLKRNITANLVGQAWTAAMALVFVPVYIHLLGIEAYGLIGFFATLQIWLQLLDAGMAPTVARETARLKAGTLDPTEYGDMLRSIEVVLGCVGFVVAVGLWLSSGWIANHWLNLGEIDPAEAALCISIMGAIIGLRFLEVSYRSALMGGSWQIAFNAYAMTIATLRNAGVIGVLLITPAPEAFFLWQLAVSIVGFFTIRLLLRRRVPTPARPSRASFAALANVWRFAGSMLTIAILSMSMSQLDKIVLSRILPLAEFGYYIFAWSVTLTLLALVLSVVTASYPAFVEAWESANKERLRNLTRSTGRLIALAGFPAAITLGLWAPEAILAWSNDPDLVTHSADLVTILCLGFAISGPFHLLYYVQLAGGWTRLIQIVYATVLAAYVPALLVWTGYSGAIAAAWLWVAVNFAYLAIQGPIVFARFLEGGFTRWLLRDNLVIAGAALVVPLGARLLQVSPEGRFESLAAVVLIGGLSLLSASLCVPEVRKASLDLLRSRLAPSAAD